MEKMLRVAPQDFVQWTVRQIRQGGGLVPFVGSGLSASSGILTGQDFTNFLAWTMYRCVVPDATKTRHDLRRDGWPDPPNQNQANLAKKWVWEEFVKICDACGVEVNNQSLAANLLVSDAAKQAVGTLGQKKSTANKDPLSWKMLRPLVPDILWSATSGQYDDDTRQLFASMRKARALRTPPLRQGQFSTSRAYIEEAAIRALHEWRGTLEFLARLRVRNDELDMPLRLDEEPNQSVIDGFNFAITHGRRPNLAHNMLCHLAGRARIRTILTTNFDALIEEAFRDLGQQIESIPVSLRGELPAEATVFAQNSVIKLHGSLLETRADYSLDDPPSPEDLQRFFTYVRGRAPGSHVASGHLPALLLVCGYSGSDLRCVQMIQYLLDADPAAKVLWVCYNENDIRSLERAFPNYGAIHPTAKAGEDLIEELNNASTRIIATTTNRCDLLLYDFYQRLTLSLPRGGFNYQFNPNVPPGFDDAGSELLETPDDPHDHVQLNDYKRKRSGLDHAQKELVCDLLKDLTTAPPIEPSKIITADGRSGLLAPLRAVFQHMTVKLRKQGIWLWLGDHADVISLAHELFTVMALRLGRFQLDHAQFGPAKANPTREEWKEYISHLFGHWDTDPGSWFVVVDGRNGTAGCAGWLGTPWVEPAATRELVEFLCALQGARNPSRPKGEGVKVLFAPYSTDRQKHLEERWDPSGPIKVTQQQIENSLVAFRPPASSPTTLPPPTPPLDPVFLARLESVYASHTARFPVVYDATAPTAPDIEKDVPIAQNLVRRRLKTSTRAAYLRRLRTAKDEWIAPAVLCAPGHPDPDNKMVARHAFYAAALIRQSRHFSVFLSEGVVPCPSRYNASQQDNDLERYDLVRGWLEEWKNQEIFYGKTGGFAWMYRDLRLGIQQLIETSIHPIKLTADQRPIWLHGARERRARIHFWIGDWYTRAFRATGHAEPLLEALYHYGQCVLHSPHARMGADASHPLAPADEDELIKKYQQRHARRALFEIIKTLRVGRREIRLWIQGPAGEVWFRPPPVTPPPPDHVIGKFTEVFEHLYGSKKGAITPPMPWEGWLDQFEIELAQHPHARETEHIALLHLQTTPPDPAHDSAKPLLVTRPDPLCAPVEWWDRLHQAVTSSPGNTAWTSIAPPGGSPDVALIFGDLIALLKNHVKSPVNDPAAAAQAASDLNKGFKKTAVEIVEALNERPQSLYVFIQLILESAYATIQCAKRRENAEHSSSQVQRNDEVPNLWVEICALCWLALDLCTELPPAKWSADCWLRIFAGTLYGLSLGRLGRFSEAHRRLNEAHGWLSKTDARLAPLEVAIIEMRRAEVHLLEAMRLRVILDGLANDPSLTFDGWRKQACPELPDKTIDQWKALYFDQNLATKVDINREKALPVLLRLHSAKLDDAWLALEPAERALSGKTHSTLWWGQLYTLRMRIYAEHWWPKHVDSDTLRPCRALMFRSRCDYTQLIYKLYRAARVTYRPDAYHVLRLINYAARAIETVYDHLHLDPSYATQSQKARVEGKKASVKKFAADMGIGAVLGADFAAFKALWPPAVSLPGSTGGSNLDMIEKFYLRIKNINGMT